MSKLKSFLILCIIFLSIGCSSGSKKSKGKRSYTYKDGIYCAEVEYYNSRTGTNSVYILKVEVKKDKLVTIFWENGGWLDSSHFTPPNISDGDASFESDANVEFFVKIIGDEYDCPNNSNYNEDEDILEYDEEDNYFNDDYYYSYPKYNEEEDNW